MMWEEFEKLAGYEVTYDDYTKIIEPMYMATNLSKTEFIQCIDKKRFALKTKEQIVREMRKIAAHLYETCEHYTGFDAQHRLEDLLDEYTKRFAISKYTYIKTETMFPNNRGCSFPTVLVEISDWNSSYDRKTLLFKRPS